MTEFAGTFTEGGVEYCTCADGLHAVRATDRELRECRLLPETAVVDANAFMDLPNLEEVVLPEGLSMIARSAFLGCKRLVRVQVPESLRAIGSAAFFGTAIEAIRIPAGCTFIGSHALVSNDRGTDIVKRDQQAPSALRMVDIDPQNPRFFLHSGVLCERIPAAPAAGTGPDPYERAVYDTATYVTETGVDLGVPSVTKGEVQPADRQEAPQVAAVLWVGPETDVDLPDGTTTICQFAFAGLDEIDSMRFPHTLKWVQPLGLSFLRAPQSLVIDVKDPQAAKGSARVVLHPPQDETGEHAILHSFSTSIFDAHVLARNCDNATSWAGDTFQHAQEAVSRLHDPVLLEPAFRASYERYLQNNPENVYRQFALHDYYRGFDQLRDLGLLGPEEIDRAIEVSSQAGCIATTSYLLQAGSGSTGGKRQQVQPGHGSAAGLDLSV